MQVPHGEAAAQTKDAAGEDSRGTADDGHTADSEGKEAGGPGRGVDLHQHRDHQEDSQHDKEGGQDPDTGGHPGDKGTVTLLCLELQCEGVMRGRQPLCCEKDQRKVKGDEE